MLLSSGGCVSSLSSTTDVGGPEPSDCGISRPVLALYLTSLALLPWTWFPPFPWVHEHAQWSDVVFALTAILWAIDRWRRENWPSLSSAHIAMVLYVVCAGVSLLVSPVARAAGAVKLLGMSELCALAVITSDLVRDRRVGRAVARVIVATSLITALAAVIALILYYGGVSTPMVGIYGELVPSKWYARIQAGFYNPNLLANFCIFSSAVITRDEAELPSSLRRVTIAMLWITVLLTFSRGAIGFGLAVIIRAANNRFRKIVAGVSAVAAVALMCSMSLWHLSLDPSHPRALHFDLSVPSSRRQAVVTTLHTITASPLSGSGVGSSPGLYDGVPFDAHMTAVNA